MYIIFEIIFCRHIEQKNTMDNILVAIDFSESSKNAGKYAIDLAAKAYADITYLNISTVQVIDPVAPAFYIDPLLKEKEEESAKMLEEYKDSFEDKSYIDNSPINIFTKTGVGVPAIEINERLLENKYDLLVLGSKKGDFWTKLTGSTAVDVVNTAEVPVLVIPEKAQFKGLKSVVAATNLLEGDSEFLREVIAFCKNFNAHLLIIHVNDSGSEKEEKQFLKLKKDIKQDLKYGNVHFESIRLKDPGKVIELIAEIENADLIALKKQERSFISSIFHTSMVREKIYHSELPLLIYH